MSIITVQHNGVNYSMSEASIEAAYRHREREYRIQDAKRQIEWFIHGTDPESLSEDECKENETTFESTHGITCDELREAYNIAYEHYVDNIDCNEPENVTWENAVKHALEQIKNNKK